MSKRIFHILLALITSSFFYSGIVFADGKELYTSKGCVTCHGPDGKSLVPVYPSLAGQHKGYLVSQSKDIKEGKRTNGLSAAMVPMIANVSDDEIEQIADYLSKQK